MLGIETRSCGRLTAIRPLLILNLASQCRGFHPGLLPTPNSFALNDNQFAQALKDANVSKVCFVRHGDTQRADVDFERQLTLDGVAQAKEAGSSLFGRTDLLPFYATVVASPAPRVLSTAKHFLESVVARDGDTTSICQFHTPSVAYDGTMQPEGSALFQELGYASLRTYLDHPDPEKQATAQRVLSEYGASMCAELYNCVLANTATKDATTDPSVLNSRTLLCFGHAIYLPSAALAVASLLRCHPLDILLDRPVGHVEGYLVDAVQQSVHYLQRPEK